MSIKPPKSKFGGMEEKEQPLYAITYASGDITFVDGITGKIVNSGRSASGLQNRTIVGEIERVGLPQNSTEV